jgi:hypothetical protein
MGTEMPASPIPAGRSISSLRAPRGTSFIRLAFAALFLLGFLGLVGFLLKDYLPGVLPNLVWHDETEEVGTPDVRVPTVTPGSLDSTPEPSGSPKLTANGSAEMTAPTSSPPVAEETKAPPTPIIVGFDPTEPVPPKAQPVMAGESESLESFSSPKPAISTAVPVDAAPKTPQTADSLLEVPSKPAMSPTSPASPTAEPSSLAQSHTIEEDDAPPEAKPAAEALKKFLSASSLAERLQYTLGAELMKPLMERYYTRSADGPVIVDRIQFVRMDPNPELGSGRHCIFSLENKTWEFPVPVMLEEQADGFKVDWLAFVEFKDRLLEKFFQACQEGPARFHVGIIRQHYFEDGVPNVDRKDAFRVMPAPPNSYNASVFLDKDSALAQELRTRLPWETHVWAVVELEWKKLGSQQWVELSAVPQMHWYSLPMAPRPISTPQKNVEKEDMPPGISKNGKGSSKASGSTGGSNMPPPGIRKSTPLPSTIKRPLPVGR